MGVVVKRAWALWLTGPEQLGQGTRKNPLLARLPSGSHSTLAPEKGAEGRYSFRIVSPQSFRVCLGGETHCFVCIRNVGCTASR